MTPAPTLYLLRHGQTEWNAERRIQGRLDSPLTDLGKAQVRRAAGVLAGRIDPHSARFVSSPLGRARASMDIVAETLGRTPGAYEVDDAVAELDFGAWCGRLVEELKAEDAWAARSRDKWNFVPPGGESYAAMARRAAAWLDRVAQDTVLVAHGAFGRTLRGVHAGLTPDEIFALDEPQDCVFMLNAHGVARLDAED